MPKNTQKDTTKQPDVSVHIPEGTDLNQLQLAGEAEAILTKYSYLQITDSTPIPPPVVVIKINGEIISTEGNITTISGASKSGKSAFSGMLIAGAIATGEYDGFPGVEVMPSNGKAVLHFDTEQARHKHQSNLKSVLRRAGLESCPANMLSYNIRQEDLENYSAITEDLISAAHKKYNGVHIVVVDGGADYIRDVNEPNQSNAIVKFYEDLAIKYRTSVIIIVHVNPGSEKERGHLGSQLQRKSESVLSIKSQGDISCLEPKFLRSAGKGDIPLMQFMFDKQKGYHVYCGIKPAEDSGKDIKRVHDIKQLAKKVFAPPISLNYADAIDSIMKHAQKQIATAKDRFKEMKAHQFIVQGGDKNWRLNMTKE